jgi:uncharacterized protein YeaO (DUF488 family)
MKAGDDVALRPAEHRLHGSRRLEESERKEHPSMSEKKGSAQSSTPTVRVRRIYDEVQKSDGTRVLVDRVWPRGVSKDKAELDEWIKDVAPSTELRKWYSHDPEKFDEFARRFRKELDEDEAAEALDSLRDLAKKGTLTLLTAAKRDDISQATVLAEILNGGKQTSGKQTNSKQTSSKQTSDKKKTSSSSNDGKDGQ